MNDRAIAAMAAEIGGDEARTRFSLILSGTVPYQYFLLADPYRVIVDIADVDFRASASMMYQTGRAAWQSGKQKMWIPFS